MSREQVRVSVIVPNYNHERFLHKRLESIVHQTFSDLEVIVLDDASQDKSLQVIEPFLSDPRLSLHINQENSGSPFIQWNRGARLASGKYLWFAESDDYAHPEFLERMVPLLEKDHGTGMGYCGSLMVDPEGEVLGAARPSNMFDRRRWAEDFVNRGREECRDFLYFCNTIPNASAVLLRRDLFLEIGGADESMTMYGDWDVWVKILLKSDLSYVSQSLNFFRVPHPRSQRVMTIAEDPKIDEWVRVVRYVEENVPVSPPQRRRAERYLSQKLLEFSLRSVLHQRGRGKILKSIRAGQDFDPFLISKMAFLPFVLLKERALGAVKYRYL